MGEKVKLGEDTKRVEPVSSQPPPPKPKSTYYSDKPAGEGGGKKEKKSRRTYRQKGALQEGVSTKAIVPKEKKIPNGKIQKGDPKEERHCRRRKKRIAMLHPVILHRCQRWNRTGGQ